MLLSITNILKTVKKKKETRFCCFKVSLDL